MKIHQVILFRCRQVCQHIISSKCLTQRFVVSLMIAFVILVAVLPLFLELYQKRKLRYDLVQSLHSYHKAYASYLKNIYKVELKNKLAYKYGTEMSGLQNSISVFQVVQPIWLRVEKSNSLLQTLKPKLPNKHETFFYLPIDFKVSASKQQLNALIQSLLVLPYADVMQKISCDYAGNQAQQNQSYYDCQIQLSAISLKEI